MTDNLKNLQLENFISIDVETTGLDIKQHKIIELAACRFENGLIVEKYSKLVNPNSHISILFKIKMSRLEYLIFRMKMKLNSWSAWRRLK